MYRTLSTIYYISIVIASIYGINYEGSKLYGAIPADRNQESTLMKMDKMGYDVWVRRKKTNDTKILAPPYLVQELKNMLNESIISVKLQRANMESLIKQRETRDDNERRFMNTQPNFFDFDRFPRYEEIVNFTRSLVKRSKYSEIISIGRSFEGRSIIGLKIKGSKKNPAIFIDSGIHAREWAAPVTALHLMKKVVEHEDTIRRKLTIYIIPTVNPDGYEFSHSVDRFWRKTRSRIVGTRCIGVDANRNFDSHWAEFGTNLHPCSDTFPGYEAFTEPESRAVRDAILAIKPTLYLTLHSYGSMLLYPWGFTRSLPHNWRELDRLAKIAAHKLKQVNGQDYIIGSSTNVLYKASGGSDDWAMQKARVPLVYKIELPNYGEGFIMPAEEIKPMIKETYEAFKIFARYVCALRYTNHT